MNEKAPLKLLLVEDNPGDALLIEEQLLDAGESTFVTRLVGRLSEALEWLERESFDLVLLDMSLPDSHGAETFERVHTACPEVPVVVLSGLDDEAVAAATVKQGAQDYLLKGRVDGELLGRSIRYAIERHQLVIELRNLAVVDELTGLRNRRGLGLVGQHQLDVAHREGKPAGLLFIDLNRFKQINDVHGHQEGDRALLDVSRILQETFRESDIIARVGGDEFCVLMTTLDQAGIKTAAARLETAVEAHNELKNRPYTLSLSTGAALAPQDKSVSVDELIGLADGRMYTAKFSSEKARTILVVDDSETQLLLTRAALEPTYVIITAGTGRDAVETAVNMQPDLVLLDLNLPDLHGTEIVRILREKTNTRAIPIIIITGHTDWDSEVDNLKAGADDYLSKPFNAHALRLRVDKLVKRSAGR